MRRNYSTVVSEIPSESVLTTGTRPPSKLQFNITLIVSVLAPCTIVGFAGICILLLVKLNLMWKQKKERSIANEVNQTYNDSEVIDPIYETIPSTEPENLTQDNFGITMMRNDAYVYNNIHSQETKCCHSPPVDFNISNNEAYVPSEKVIIKYQAA
jgi:hypothetical protein